MELAIDPAAPPAPARRRLSTRRKLAAMAAVAAVALPFQALAHWRDTHGIFINATESLPNWAFLVEAGRFPASRTDYVVFAPPRDPLVLRHFGRDPSPFAKIAYGLPGDMVTRTGNRVFVNGRLVARTKPLTRLGEPLAVGPVGRVPRGCVFAGTPHKDGFDSRYAAIGWVCARQIVGVGTPIL